MAPEKLVKSALDIGAWERSEAYYELIGFINAVSTCVQGKKISDEAEKSPGVDKVLAVIAHLNRLIDETPPVDQPQRFGNMAFREWHRKMKESAKDTLAQLVPEDKAEAVEELLVYYVDCFGNSTRIDYGTGHELAFLFLLCCLFKLGVLTREDQLAVGLKVFDAYLRLARRLQLTYRMEPAGSHGVWSLDDFQFIPFIWGSAQFAMNPAIEPAQFLEETVIERLREDFMFISCIDYIIKVKTGHFAEHSNQLWGISAVPSWSKINTGLVQMYRKEVLSKFPVIQHVFFGSLMSFKQTAAGSVLSTPRLGRPIAPPTRTMLPPKLGGDGPK